MPAESAETVQPRWRRSETVAGIVSFRLSSWAHYFDFLEAEVFERTSAPRHKYIWRGQRRSDWILNSSLDRLFASLTLSNSPDLEKLTAQHLESFQYAARGRRGLNPAKLLEDDMWALGQHFGLATPLLDWTRSPFAAAYFAFEERDDNPTEYRVVWGLDQYAIKQRSDELQEQESYEKGRPPVIDFIDPMLDENQRLVSQGGLFTRSPVGVSIDQWVQSAFANSAGAVLIRIEIPNTDRLMCLRTLDRMNINHLSLFPDLSGASRFTNLKLELEQ